MSVYTLNDYTFRTDQVISITLKSNNTLEVALTKPVDSISYNSRPGKSASQAFEELSKLLGKPFKCEYTKFLNLENVICVESIFNSLKLYMNGLSSWWEPLSYSSEDEKNSALESIRSAMND